MDNLLAFITVVPHILNKQEIEDLFNEVLTNIIKMSIRSEIL